MLVSGQRCTRRMPSSLNSPACSRSPRRSYSRSAHERLPSCGMCTSFATLAHNRVGFRDQGTEREDGSRRTSYEHQHPHPRGLGRGSRRETQGRMMFILWCAAFALRKRHVTTPGGGQTIRDLVECAAGQSRREVGNPTKRDLLRGI
jgi:hypothetical protein